MIDFIIKFEKSKKHTDKDINTYISYLFALADKDNSSAITALGGLYYSGQFLGQDFAKAKEYYLRGTKLGDLQSLINLGYIYYYARCGGKPDYLNAYRCFSKAALIEDSSTQTEAIYKLSDMYDNGYFVEKDQEFAYLLLKPLLFKENGEMTRVNNHSYLGDILVRCAKFSDKEHTKKDYSPYYFYKYNALANKVIKDRYDGSWFGDKELLKRTKEGIALADEECQDDIPYSKRDINSDVIYKTILDFADKMSKAEFYILPSSFRYDKDGNLVLSVQCFNAYFSFPEINYADRINDMDLVFYNATLTNDVETINETIKEDPLSVGPISFELNSDPSKHLMDVYTNDNMITSIKFPTKKIHMYFGQITRKEGKRTIKISNDNYLPYYDGQNDIHLA